jgi:hypothetical protein
MEESTHAAASADLQQVNGDACKGPGELAATTSHDHHLMSRGDRTG